MNKEPIYCGLAFGSMYVNVHGACLPCCGIDPNQFHTSIKKDSLKNPLDTINSRSLIEFRRQLKNGHWPAACHNCKSNEDQQAESMRTIWNRYITDAPLDVNIDPINVEYLSLTFGNKCNSKCMTCNSGSSSLWQDEEKFIFGPKGVIPNRLVIHDTFVDITDEISEKLITTFPRLKQISFLGGEPTILDEHQNLLKLLIKNDKSKDLHLSYVTNLTNITDELIELWSHFKYVGVSLSIDGYGKVNEYIRYPFKWEKVQENLHKYLKLTTERENFSIGISCTVSLLNICHIADLIDFYLEVDSTYAKNASNVKLPSYYLNRVTFPDFLNLNLLPVEYRQQSLEKAIALQEKIKSMKVNESVVNSVNVLINWLNEPQVNDTQLKDMAKKFILSSDQYRQRTIEDYIPNLLNQL